MSRVVVLDSGVLGLITKPNKKSIEDRAAAQWAIDLLAAGNQIVVLAIADYEIRRELVRIGSANGLAALNAWNAGEPGRFLELTNADLRLACQLWAMARGLGLGPTAYIVATLLPRQ